jgi:hypothetical protein
MLLNPGERAWVQCLHQERSNASDQCAKIRMHDPWSIGRQEQARVVAFGNYRQPWRDAIWIL